MSLTRGGDERCILKRAATLPCNLKTGPNAARLKSAVPISTALEQFGNHSILNNPLFPFIFLSFLFRGRKQLDIILAGLARKSLALIF